MDPLNRPDADFAATVERHRRELHVHCYRMLASFEEAEDAVQESLVKAWRHRAQFDGDNERAWLYRIATNTCLDALRRTKRRVPTATTVREIPWAQPYPDHLLDELEAVPATTDGPDAVVVARETIELAYLAAVQVLPATQRAVLLLRDVLGWSAAETAEALDTTVAAANSALQRARATMQRELPNGREDSATRAPTEDERSLMERLIAAHEQCDAHAAAALMRDDIRISMPPIALSFVGLAEFLPQLERVFGPERDGDWRLLPARANRMPAAACYFRPYGEDEFRAFKFDVVRIEGDEVAEITTFGTDQFAVFGFPAVLPA